MFKIYSESDVFTGRTLWLLEYLIECNLCKTTLLSIDMLDYLPVLDVTFGNQLRDPMSLAYTNYNYYDFDLGRWEPSDVPAIIFNVTNILKLENQKEIDGVLIHELVHVKQMLAGELVYQDNLEHPIIYKGVKYTPEMLDPKDYYRRYWEIEAIMEQLRHTHPEDPEGRFEFLKKEYEDWIKRNRK